MTRAMEAVELNDYAAADDPAARLLRSAQEAVRLPGGLYVWGSLDVLLRPRVAIGGSRRSSGWNATAIEALAGRLAVSGACIVSGGAVGADMAAHRGALERGGVTVVVTPAPLESLDLGRWRPGAAKLWDPDRCLFVSPFHKNEVVTRAHPVLRNRLIAALGQAVVAGETGLTGGTNHLLRFARELRAPTWFLTPPDVSEELRAALMRLQEWGARPFTPEHALDDSLAAEIMAAARRHTAKPGTPSLFDGLE